MTFSRLAVGRPTPGAAPRLVAAERPATARRLWRWRIGDTIGWHSSLKVRMTFRACLTILAAAVAPVLAAGAQPSSADRSPFASTHGSISGIDTMGLHRTLDSLVKHYHGVLGYSIHSLDTGERLTLRGDETFPTAS